ncbi:hypothetical protein K440DRAFT_645585 [Wilcoxina mikolae CBS 423.85]|nr:hypothetical protein K440DRAFT_645585 [Wilcoxina mikolae CBS 423.85]
MPPKRGTASYQQQRMQTMCRAVLECQITEPKIDFTRFAQRMGYKNERVAQDSYHRFRAMLRGDKHYGNRKGRTVEKFQKKLRDLGEGPDAPARYEVSEEEEETGHGFNFSRGEESEGSSGTVTSGASATPGGERRGFFFTGETVVLDPDESETRREKEKEEGEGKEKEKVKLEVKNEPEVWEWEGTAGFKGYI